MLGRTALRQPSLLPKGIPRAHPGARGDPTRPSVRPVENEAARRALERPRADAQTTSWLIRFLLLLSVACGITCVYVWQVSVVQDLRRQTVKMEAELDRIEQDNVSLMLELAALESPAYIEAQADQMGVGVGRAPIHVELATTNLSSAQTRAMAGNTILTPGTIFEEDGNELLPIAAARRLSDRLSILIRDVRSFASSLGMHAGRARAGLSQASWAP